MEAGPLLPPARCHEGDTTHDTPGSRKKGAHDEGGADDLAVASAILHGGRVVVSEGELDLSLFVDLLL